MTKARKQRNSSIELLRIVAMVDIVVFHFLARTFGLYVIGNDRLGQDHLLGELLAFHVGALGVPCFMFISGYFGIRWRRDRFVDMVGQGLFYCLVSVAGLLAMGAAFDHKWLCFINEWWFLEAYVVVYLLSPGLNHLVETFTPRRLLLATAFLWLMLFSATVKQCELGGVILLIAIYLTARYMRLYLSDRLRRNAHWLALGLLMVQLTLTATAVGIGHLGLKPLLMSYSNPLNTLAVGFLVVAVERVRLHSCVVNMLAASTLAVYLLSESGFGQRFFAPIFPSNFILWRFVVGAVAVYLACFAVDRVRMFLFKHLFSQLLRIKNRAAKLVR